MEQIIQRQNTTLDNNSIAYNQHENKSILSCCIDSICSFIGNIKSIAARKCEQVALAFGKSRKQQIENLEKQMFLTEKQMSAFCSEQLKCNVFDKVVTGSPQSDNYLQTISKIKEIETLFSACSTRLANLFETITKCERLGKTDPESNLKAISLLTSMLTLIAKCIDEETQKNLFLHKIINIESRAITEIENDIKQLLLPLSVIQPNIMMIMGKKEIIVRFFRQLKLNEKFLNVIEKQQKNLLKIKGKYSERFQVEFDEPIQPSAPLLTSFEQINPPSYNPVIS